MLLQRSYTWSNDVLFYRNYHYRWEETNEVFQISGLTAHIVHQIRLYLEDKMENVAIETDNDGAINNNNKFAT
jgi:hypothetical protein